MLIIKTSRLLSSQTKHYDKAVHIIIVAVQYITDSMCLYLD